MIIHTLNKIETNKIYKNIWITDHDGNWHSGLTIHIIREATYDEYIQYLKDENITVSQKILETNKKCYFYLALMD